MPLTQANSALTHLFAKGLSPKNLQIVGDSAGCHLALQIFSHALHPEILSSIAPSPLESAEPIAGAYLLSPWVDPQANGSGSGSFHENRDKDIITPATYRYIGEIGGLPIHSLPPSQQAFLAPSVAPKGWYDGLERFVSRLLITAGEYECPRNEIVAFRKNNLEGYREATVVIIEEGVHDDPVVDIAAAATGTGEHVPTEKIIVDWLWEGFS